ncbi:uncharacterized protein LOC131680139 [Topomyia yanbarensis]|uniref:uncharacterized protein LOC131680139 n=1 Tax=Topomyia yanbarensis TaxID=2498891 RepID=UPI00273C34E6|nr:uncharacterized protein LOC131680139 [Topomyia yanbarensis]
MSLNELIDGQKVEVVSHPTLNITHGVVYDIDTKDMSNEELLDELKGQGVAAVRRITKLHEGVVSNTPLVVISFSGSTLPDYIYLGLVRTSIRPYYPSPMLCYRCGKFGHGTRVCPNKETCLNCSLNHPSAKDNPCTQVSKCINCSGEHSTRAKECPKYMEEVAIIKAKVSLNLSFPEARALITQKRKGPSYAEQTQKGTESKDNEKDSTIARLKAELIRLKGEKSNPPKDDRDEEISNLKHHLAEAVRQLRIAKQQLTEVTKENSRANTSPKVEQGNVNKLNPTTTISTECNVVAAKQQRDPRLRDERKQQRNRSRAGEGDKSRSPIGNKTEPAPPKQQRTTRANSRNNSPSLSGHLNISDTETTQNSMPQASFVMSD